MEPPGPCQEAGALVAAAMTRAEVRAKMEQDRLRELDRVERAAARGSARAKGRVPPPDAQRPRAQPSIAALRARSGGSSGRPPIHPARRPCSAASPAAARSTYSRALGRTSFSEAVAHGPVSELRLAQEEVLRSVQAMQKAFPPSQRRPGTSGARQRSALDALMSTQHQRDILLEQLLSRSE